MSIYRFISFIIFVIGIVDAPCAMAAQTFFGDFSGAAEIPSNASTGSGSAFLTYDASTYVLTVNARFSALVSTTTAAHIHCCQAIPGDSNAGVATQTPSFSSFPLAVASGTYTMSFNLMLASSYNPAFVTAQGSITAARTALVTGIGNGTAYFNIHSTAFPGGEIRAKMQEFLFRNGFEN
jgi:CHRD domain